MFHLRKAIIILGPQEDALKEDRPEVGCGLKNRKGRRRVTA